MTESPKKKTAPGRKWLKRVAFSLATVVLVLAALDLGIGWYLRGKWIPRVTRPDSDLLMRLRPGSEAMYQVGQMTGEQWGPEAPEVSIRINPDGYRGRLVAKAKSPGEFRVVCLGDSITMGLDVDEDMTYPAQLERLLQDRYPGRKITVINAGVLSYSSRQGLYLFKEKFLAYQPDVVIWSFGFNDHGLSPIISARDVDLVPLEPGGPINTSPAKKRLILWLSNRPLVKGIYGLVLPIVWKINAIPLLARLSQPDELPAVTLTPEQFSQARVPPREYEVHLLEMSQLAQQYHFRLVVIRFFGTNDLYADVAQRFCASHHADYVDFAAGFARALRSEALAQSPYPEMFKFYQPALSQESLDTFPMLQVTTDNLHPNNLGQHLIAETLAEKIGPDRKPEQ